MHHSVHQLKLHSGESSKCQFDKTFAVYKVKSNIQYILLHYITAKVTKVGKFFLEKVKEYQRRGIIQRMYVYFLYPRNLHFSLLKISLH